MKYIFLSLLMSLTAVAQVAQTPTQIFTSTFPARSFGTTISDQAFCLQRPGQPIEGHNLDQQQRIASVSKLFVSLTAFETIPSDYRWTTRFFINGRRMHIKGGADPWFGEEKLLILIEAMRTAGILQLDELTFDPNFWFLDIPLPTYTRETPEEARKSLRRYFSATGRLGAAARELKAEVIALMAREGASYTMPRNGIATADVRVSETNPLEGLPGTFVWTHKSRPMHEIIKAMNVYSKNEVAERLWKLTNNIRPADEIFAANALPPSEIFLHTGSGLPLLIEGIRVDNTSSCRTVIKLIEVLDREIARAGLALTQVAGSGIDIGTLRNRFPQDPALKRSIIAKTGSVDNTATLSGWLLGAERYRFAILSSAADTSGLKDFQDDFLSRIMATAPLGPPNQMTYQRSSLFPVRGEFFEQP